MGVLAIWRYPVKAVLGQLLRGARVGVAGLEGDRRWVVTDTRTGEKIANKRGPTDPRLRACRAAIVDGVLVMTLPGGSRTTGVDEASAALSNLLGRPVELREDDAPAHDFAPLHLMTTRSLAHVRRVAPHSDWDPRRFRPNLVLDDGAGGGLSEPDLVGAWLTGHALRLEVQLPTPRCVVPTRAHEELPRDPALLRRITAESRWDLGPFGNQPCLGTYAQVAAPGDLAVGDRLDVAPRAGRTAQEAVAEVVRCIDL